MSPADLLDLLTQLTFLWVAGTTVFNWGKQRDQTRFDIALIFIALAIAILALDLQRILPEWGRLLSLVLLLMIVAHPYLLLRVAYYFHPHSKNIHRWALAGLLVVSGAVFFRDISEAPMIAGLILYFALAQGYATYLLIRGALTIPGLTGRRLRLASIGSGLFGLVFLIAFVVTLIGLVTEVPPVIQEIASPLIRVLAILSGLTYFFGFAPPRALRRLWQLSELHLFLQQTSRQLSEHRMVILDELAAAGMRTVGGSGVVIARCDTAGQHLTLDLPGSPPELPELHARDRTGRIWYERPARVEPVPGDTWPVVNQWGLDEQARCLFIVPIRSPLRPWGLMIIALRYAPLFAQDDLELLTLIAEQSAIPLDYAPLVEELQVTNRSLEQRVVERTAQLEKINRDLDLQIADRKRAEGNLQKSEARYLSTLDTMMEGCQVIGFDWTYRYINEAAARQGRQTRESLLGHTMMEIYPGIESTALFVALQRCMDGRVPHQMENKFHYADGSRGWFDLSIQPVPEGVFILSVDISERKRAELALLESEARKAAILETALDCIVTVDQDGRILEFNPAAERTFGRTLDAVLGGEMAGLLFTDEAAGRIRLEFENYLATRENKILGKRIELAGKRSDGTEFPMEMTLTRVTNSDPPVFTGFMRDITDRKLVEAAIREREARYRHIFESTPVAVWEQDFTEVLQVIDDLKRRGITDVRQHFSQQADVTRQTLSLVHVLDVNQQSLALFGAASKTEFLESLDRIVLPETLELFVEELAAIAGGQTYFEGETRLKTLQGDVRDILLTVHFPEPGGRLDHTLVSLVDITARRLAEESVLRSQTQLAGIINSAMDAIISIDENQKILIFNPAAEKMFQRFADKVIGKPLSMLIPDRFRALHESDVRAFGDSGVTKRAMGRMDAVRGLRLNGDEFPMEASISQIQVNGRKIYTAILRDITERRRAEAALRESESKFRTLFETMNEGFSINEILCNEAGEPYDLRYLEVNPAFETQTGLKAADVLGRTTLELFPGAEPIWFERYGKVALTGEPAHFEAQFGPLGRWFEVNAYQTEPGRFAAVFFDTTERRQAQEELSRLNIDLEKRVAERTSQLASAIRELEAFSYSVSHDLRAPLRSIDGFSQALLEDYGDQIPSEGRNYLDRVRAAAQRMALLIDDLLALSRVTRTPVARKPVDLSLLAERILAELRLEQPDRTVSLSVTPNLMVDGDENLLQIALRNLLTNAWKFTSKKQAARIEFGVQEGADGRVFYVRDNGSGFDMTYVDKLFGAFQRLHSTDDFPGTGIGLATVQRILHKHGGKVWAVGEVDQGATFYFML